MVLIIPSGPRSHLTSTKSHQLLQKLGLSLTQLNPQSTNLLTAHSKWRQLKSLQRKSTAAHPHRTFNLLHKGEFPQTASLPRGKVRERIPCGRCEQGILKGGVRAQLWVPSSAALAHTSPWDPSTPPFLVLNHPTPDT